MKGEFAVAAQAALLLAAFASSAVVSAAGTTERVSLSTAGTAGNASSYATSIGGDGRFVAFHSDAGNLVPRDTNGRSDVFLRDRRNGTTELISVALSGGANGPSYWPSVSADGRYAAFQSYASNLVTGDTNGRADIFVRDRSSLTTQRLVPVGGVQPNGDSSAPSISADGRYVAFASQADNLVAADGNAAADVFVYDRQSGSIERASVSGGGVGANGSSDRPAISADGRYVAFQSAASNLVPGDGNWSTDIFVRDRSGGTIERVSLSSSGAQSNGVSFYPAISGDGRYVAFQSYASNLVTGDTNLAADIFVYDRQYHSIERVSVPASGEANGASERPTISSDGRFVAFHSAASNLVPGDGNARLDAFVRDRVQGTTERVSLSSAGSEGNGDSFWAAISADGAHVAFTSLANNLVSGDYGWVYDTFVRDRPLTDTIAPETAASPSGALGMNGWYTSNVQVSLTATDQGGSGVKEIRYAVDGAPEVVVGAASASFVLSGEGTHNISYYARDNAGNVETAKALTVKIDKTLPAITITAPGNVTYLPNQVVAASYAAVDSISGVASVSGTVPSGSNVDTSTVGSRSFTVSAADNAGNSSSSAATYQVAYGVRVLSNDAKAANDGSTVPIKVQVVDASGANLSTAGLVVAAQSISPLGTLDDSGKANPGNAFRYDPTLGGTGGYIFNLSTKGLVPGSYTLNFTAAGDLTTHGVQLVVKGNTGASSAPPTAIAGNPFSAAADTTPTPTAIAANLSPTAIAATATPDPAVGSSVTAIAVSTYARH